MTLEQAKGSMGFVERAFFCHSLALLLYNLHIRGKYLLNLSPSTLWVSPTAAALPMDLMCNLDFQKRFKAKILTEAKPPESLTAPNFNPFAWDMYCFALIVVDLFSMVTPVTSHNSQCRHK